MLCHAWKQWGEAHHRQKGCDLVLGSLFTKQKVLPLPSIRNDTEILPHLLQPILWCYPSLRSEWYIRGCKLLLFSFILRERGKRASGRWMEQHPRIASWEVFISRISLQALLPNNSMVHMRRYIFYTHWGLLTPNSPQSHIHQLNVLPIIPGPYPSN